MPTYDYRCRKCKHRFELFHGITDETVKRCPRCRAKAERVPSGGAGILFKGSGFYITDYRSQSYRDKARQEKAAPSAGGAGSGAAGDSSPASSGGPASSSGKAPSPAPGKAEGGSRGKGRGSSSSPRDGG